MEDFLDDQEYALFSTATTRLLRSKDPSPPHRRVRASEPAEMPVRKIRVERRSSVASTLSSVSTDGGNPGRPTHRYLPPRIPRGTPAERASLLRELSIFLEECSSSRGEPFTHTSLDPTGKYFLSPECLDDFFTYYHNCVSRAIPLTLTEKPNGPAPLRVDFDLLFTVSSDAERQYTPEIVTAIVAQYSSLIRDVLAPSVDPTKPTMCLLLEKSSPRQEPNGTMKDGFHLHFPHFICQSFMAEYLRAQILDWMEETGLWRGIPLAVPLTKVVDPGIGSKTWLMYGSAKNREAEPYLVTTAYDGEGDEIDLSSVFSDEMVDRKLSVRYYLPRFLSIHGHPIATAIRDEYAEIAESFDSQKRSRRMATAVRHRSDEDVLAELQMIRDGDIMLMLRPTRADNHDEWMDVGWTLFCISEGRKEGLELWDEWSSKAEPHSCGTCEDMWSRMEVRGKTIGSLLAMAKLDSPVLYDEWRKTQLSYHLYNSVAEPKPSEHDVAKVIAKLYEGRFLCADSKKDIWYEFTNHRWHLLDDALTLKKLIVSEVVDVFYRFKTTISSTQTSADDSREAEKKKMHEDRVRAIITALKTSTFLKKVIEMCKLYFYDSSFSTRQNENRDLWVFENGVFDLRLGSFREGRPDDYATYSCGLNYIEFKVSDPELKRFDSFLSRIFPNPVLRSYFLDMLCMSVCGGNIHKKFGVCSGSGNNGKSVTFNLLEKAFGDYMIKFPREMFVGSEATSSGPRPELARVRGRRLAVIQEIGAHEKLRIGVLKEMTGNDSFFARTIYDHGKEIKPQFTLMLQCNDPPRIPGHDEATWNRVELIHFESKFGYDRERRQMPPVKIEDQWKKRHFIADPELNSKLGEMAPVLIWLLLHRIPEYRARGMIPPDEVKTDTEKYKARNDIYLQFFTEYLEPEPPRLVEPTGITVSSLFADFKIWFLENHPAYLKEKIGKLSFQEGMSKLMGPPARGVWHGYRIVTVDPTQ